ncbi:MAG: bacillithiol biosynthesis deacetylase BshB1 [Candidatus Hydrogenedentes bacterium]|nr:bacillithiol biosynthesis deacetylase BshB1 [Candidatus Hydrogenedentota bacterium]
MTVDVLAVGAHPDDVELGVGGMLHKLTQSGRSAAVLDLTAGEMSTRGSVDERRIEAQRAAGILGVAERAIASLPDGALANTPEQRREVIPFLRRFRPRIILAPMREDRHPDHVAAHGLVRDANFFAGLVKIDTGQEPHRAQRIYYYHPYYGGREMPPFVVDISEHFEAKLDALRAHASQFHNPAYPGRATHISSPEFWESIRTKAAYWGDRIGVRYGEPLFSDGPAGIALPPGLESAP